MKKISFFLCLLTLLSTNAFAKSDAKSEPLSALSKEDLRLLIIETLEKEPEILFNILKENDEAFIKSITDASATLAQKKVTSAWEEEVKTPKKYSVENRPHKGKKDAPYTIAAISDFTCNFCGNASQTLEQVYAENKDDIQIFFKANPRDEIGHLAALWFYAAFAQNEEKAWKFHDTLFLNRGALIQSPLILLREAALSVGLDLPKLEQDINQNKDRYKRLIQEDIEEIKQLKLDGTPYFLVNDIIVRGAVSKTVFDSALDFVQKNNKTNL